MPLTSPIRLRQPIVAFGVALAFGGLIAAPAGAQQAVPATATVIGIVVLAQVPGPLEVLGVGLVVGGVAIHRDRPAPG